GGGRQTASIQVAVIRASDRAVGQNGILARIHAVAPFGDALVAFPKRTHGEELRMQDGNARGDPADVDAGVSHARGEAFEEALRVRDMTPLRHQPADDRTTLRQRLDLRFSGPVRPSVLTGSLAAAHCIMATLSNPCKRRNSSRSEADIRSAGSLC